MGIFYRLILLGLSLGMAAGACFAQDFPSKPLRLVVGYSAGGANPGKLTYGSAGIGSGLHLAGELFKFMAKVDWAFPCHKVARATSWEKYAISA